MQPAPPRSGISSSTKRREMNRFWIIAQVDDSPAGISMNNVVQSISGMHPALDWIMTCHVVSPYPCPVPFNGPAPQLAFVLVQENGEGKVVETWTQVPTKSEILAKLDELANADLTHMGQGGGGIIPSGNPGGPMLSLGLFNLPGNMPAWVWLILAAYSGYKSARARTKWPWLTLAAVAAGNWVNAKRRAGKIKSISGWYHGSPDLRQILKNGFEFRLETISKIKEGLIDKFFKLSEKASAIRETDFDQYLKIIDQLEQMREDFHFPRPIYLTSRKQVAKTYADPFRAFDYQNAVPGVVNVIPHCTNELSIDALGATFKGIRIDIVLDALVRAGIDLAKAEEAILSFTFYRNDGKMTSTELAAVAHMFGFDCVNIKNVIDTYTPSKTKSTVKIVLDPSKLEVVSRISGWVAKMDGIKSVA
ncbi:MAG: hypothetical protein D6816_06080 [Bacteroidetes bacterium]|nr:MAG: hypothetical protein D6816_06080 [Bacteroidota bacterium]